MEPAMEVDIHTATINDLAAIFHIGEKVFTSQDFTNLYRTWDEYEVTHLFNTETEHVLVAESDETVIGFAMGTIIDKARSAWSYGHLLWLGVDPRYARRGIAGQLFDRFRDIMENEGISLNYSQERPWLV